MRDHIFKNGSFRGVRQGVQRGACFFKVGIRKLLAPGIEAKLPDAGADGLDGGIVNMLRPYFMLRNNAAIAKLHALPLTVAHDTANELDRITLAVHARIISARYDSFHPPTPFEELPWQAQAAIFSLLYQRGTGVSAKAPNTWAALVRGDWKDAATRLGTPAFWDGHQARRTLEGALLKELV